MKKKPFNLKRKATNIPTPDELLDSYLFEKTGPFKRKVDITIILGTDSVCSSFGSILLCRFHKVKCYLSHKEKEDLLSSVWQSMKNNKFECRRTGGSSGLISSTKENVVKKLMSHPGSAPRNGKGVIWIRGIDTWYLYYIGTYENEVKQCQYTNPVPGGSFRFHHKSIKKHQILAEFISIKPIAALIVQGIQGKLNESIEFNTSITPQAISAELMNISETQSVMMTAQSGSTDNLPLDLKPIPKQMKGNPWVLFYSIYNRDHVKFTMVAHPVGYHLDSFKHKIPSLENKFCVEMLQDRINQKMLFNSNPHGRGGGRTANHFVYGLLDWSGGQRDRRRIWTDPANAHLDHAPQNADDRLTQEIWNAFWQPNLVTVVAGINIDRL